jgi:hypothetical protein
MSLTTGLTTGPTASARPWAGAVRGHATRSRVAGVLRAARSVAVLDE